MTPTTRSRPRLARLTLTALAAALLLTGCTAAHSTAPATPNSTSTPIAIPSAVPTLNSAPLDQEISRNVLISAYSQGVYTSKVACGCSLNYAGAHVNDVYPRGTAVWMLRMTVEGQWDFGQKNDSTDVTGTTMTAQFEGRPDAAVIDTKEGPGYANQLGFPWLFSGLFPNGQTWSLLNNQPRSYLVAFHVPPGVNTLDLTFHIPEEPTDTSLSLTLPTSVVAAANASQGDKE